MQNLSELYAILFAVGGSDAAGGGGTGGTSPPSHVGGPIGSAFLRFIPQNFYKNNVLSCLQNEVAEIRGDN